MIRFTKMHGAGNDYVYIDCFSERIDDPAGLAVRISDRHFGVGSDGLILIRPSDKADCFMDMYNADGSRGKMCGNGIRCVAKYLYDQGMIENAAVTVDTLSGLRHLKLNLRQGRLDSVTVNMGTPVLVPADVPFLGGGGSPAVDVDLDTGRGTVRVTCVSMGNPHAVIFVGDADAAPVEEIGRLIENHPLFPERTNVEFVEVTDRASLKVRVWERGSGETLACGTGACASAVAAVLGGRTDRDVLVRLRGGDLKVRWDEKTGDVFLTGPAVNVFYGYFDEKAL